MKLTKAKKNKLVKELRKFLTKHNLTPKQLYDLAIDVQVEINIEEELAYEKKYGPKAAMRRMNKKTDDVLRRLYEVHGVPYEPTYLDMVAEPKKSRGKS